MMLPKRVAICASFCVALTAMPVSVIPAQSVSTTRVVIGARQPMNGTCASMIAGPSELVRTPEGKAVLRMKRELDGVSLAIEKRGADVAGMDFRRMTEVQRGVDSLLQMIARERGKNGTFPPAIMILLADSSTMMMNGKIEPGPIEFRLRELQPQVADMARSVDRSSAPTGYLGLSLSGSQIRMVTDSGSFTAHCDYPMIEAVDVGSPARDAGLSVGDTVIAYNGRDLVAQAVNYPQLLVPGRVVRVKVRRDGKARETPVTVAARPPALRENVVRFTPGVSTATPMGGMGTSTPTMLFGAQVSAVDDDFAQTLGVEPGILILRVQPGSPAAEAGLRGGEMIRAVNGTPVRDVALLHRAMRVPGAHDVKLTVSGRDTPVRIVVLRF